MEGNESLSTHIFSFNSNNQKPLKVLFFKLKPYEASNISPEFEAQRLNRYLSSEEFTKVLEKIFNINPDIIVYQGAYEGHERILCINSYECIFFCPQRKKTGYAFLWKTRILSVTSYLNIDYYLKDSIKNEEYSGGMISVFRTIDGEKYCLVNTEFNNFSFFYEYQAYVLSNQLLDFYNDSGKIIILGNLNISEQILCRPKRKISPEAMSCIRKISFERKANLVEICKRVENPKLDSVFNFYPYNSSINLKGPVQIQNIENFEESNFYFEFI